MLRLALLLVCLLLPQSLWPPLSLMKWRMGTAASRNDEWIELYNNGEATNVHGWTWAMDSTLYSTQWHHSSRGAMPS